MIENWKELQDALKIYERKIGSFLEISLIISMNISITSPCFKVPRYVESYVGIMVSEQQF